MYNHNSRGVRKNLFARAASLLILTVFVVDFLIGTAVRAFNVAHNNLHHLTTNSYRTDTTPHNSGVIGQPIYYLTACQVVVWRECRLDLLFQFFDAGVHFVDHAHGFTS
jgi:hypothetical protein